ADNSQWIHNTNFQIQARAWDVPGTTGSLSGVTSFTFDIVKPTATIYNPPNGGFVNARLPPNFGTPKDLPAGPSPVETDLSSSPPGGANSWWNGASFSGASEVFFSTTAYDANPEPDLWEWARPPNVNMTTGNTYRVRLRATDRAGNVRTNNASDEGPSFIF